jgi:hypothetical protein
MKHKEKPVKERLIDQNESLPHIKEPLLWIEDEDISSPRGSYSPNSCYLHSGNLRSYGVGAGWTARKQPPKA